MSEASRERTGAPLAQAFFIGTQGVCEGRAAFAGERSLPRSPPRSPPRRDDSAPSRPPRRVAAPLASTPLETLSGPGSRRTRMVYRERGGGTRVGKGAI